MKAEDLELQESLKKIDPKRRNRQINYFIIRHLWVYLRGRKSGRTVYDAFGIRRERLSRALDDGSIRFNSRELTKLASRTGLDPKYFTGEKVFDIPGIDAIMWHKMFTVRGLRRDAPPVRNDNKQISEDTKDRQTYNAAYKCVADPILKKIEACPRDILKNRDFWCLCYFIECEKPFGSNSDTEQKDAAIKVIADITLEEAEAYNLAWLETLVSTLERQTHMLRTVLDYRKLKK